MRKFVRAFARLSAACLLIGFVLMAGRILWLSLHVQPAHVGTRALADRDSAFATVNDVELHYRERGPAGGPAVVLLHGFLLETASLDPLADALAAEGFRVISVDRPPFGLSEKDPAADYSQHAQAALVLGLMDRLRIERAALVGHSAGAVLASRIALNDPQRVTHLAIIGGSFLEAAPNSTANTNPSLPFILRFVAHSANPVEQWGVLELQSFFTPEALAQFNQANYAEPEALPAGMGARAGRAARVAGWAASLRAFGRASFRDLTAVKAADLAALRAPTLLLWGAQDAFIPPAVGREVRAIIPGSQLVELDGCGHIPWAGCRNAPQALRTLTDFLRAGR